MTAGYCSECGSIDPLESSLDDVRLSSYVASGRLCAVSSRSPIREVSAYDAEGVAGEVNSVLAALTHEAPTSCLLMGDENESGSAGARPLSLVNFDLPEGLCRVCDWPRLAVMTSGTTASRRWIPISRRALSRSIALLGEYADGGDGWLVSCYPMSTIGGLVSMLVALHGGFPQVVGAPPDPVVLARDLPAPVHQLALPALAAAAIVRMLVRRHPYLSTTLKRVSVGGSPLTTRDRAAIESATKAMVVDGYGLTETVGAAFVNLDGSLHYPLAGVDYRVDPVGVDGSGQLSIRIDGHTPCILDPGAEDIKYAETDWIETGDLVRVDGDGIELRGRLANTVVRGRVEIQLEDLDAQLAELDSNHGAAAAFTYVHNGRQLIGVAMECTEAEFEAMRTLVREKLTAAYQPHLVKRFDELPRLASGKVDRLKLTRSVGPQP